jgi:hypothetical protein
MLPCLQRADRREMRDAVRLIDSTQVNLGLRMCEWVGLLSRAGAPRRGDYGGAHVCPSRLPRS